VARPYTPIVSPPYVPAPELTHEERVRLREPLSDTLVRILAWIVAVACFVLCAWCLVYGMMATAGWLLAVAVVLWVRSRGRWVFRWIRGVSLGLLLGAAFVFRAVPLHEMMARNDTLQESLARGGAMGLDLRDATGVLGLHVLMAGAAVISGQPHVGLELTGMLLPASKSRHGEASFFFRAPQVREAVVEMVQELDTLHKDEGKVELSAHVVHWGPEDGVHPDLPILLPITSPLLVKAWGYREGARWRLVLEASARVSWERKARYVLPWTVRGRTFAMDESILYAVEQRGWLHPYDCVWTWSVMSDDPRLQDLTHPQRGFVEEVAAEAWRLATRDHPFAEETGTTTPSRP